MPLDNAAELPPYLYYYSIILPVHYNNTNTTTNWNFDYYIFTMSPLCYLYINITLHLYYIINHEHWTTFI